jgi:uncharacterized protein DUF3108
MRFGTSQPRKTGILAVAGLLTFLLTWAATAKEPKQTKAPPDYFPLQVGYSCSYRNTEEGGYTLKVLSEEPHEGDPTRYVVELLSGVKILKTYSKTSGWILFHGETYPEHEGLQVTYDPPQQFMPNPLAMGQKWKWSGKDSTQMDYQESSGVVGAETVSVPAGKFRALKVVTEITAGGGVKTRTDWYADGVGLVKSSTDAGQFKYGSELTDYSFKKKPAK